MAISPRRPWRWRRDDERRRAEGRGALHARDARLRAALQLPVLTLGHSARLVPPRAAGELDSRAATRRLLDGEEHAAIDLDRLLDGRLFAAWDRQVRPRHWTQRRRALCVTCAARAAVLLAAA
eukprot:6173591-Pleurochrysis_carterae.AAC.1